MARIPGRAEEENPRHRLGRLGEEIAVRHLLRHGYVVLARNFRCPQGEIDVVARDGACLALVEVRARRGRSHGTPEESITAAKRERLARLADAYLQTLADPPEDYRVDIVAVELAPDGRLLRVDLIKNALA